MRKQCWLTIIGTTLWLASPSSAADPVRAWDQDFNDAFPFVVISDVDPGTGAIGVPSEIGSGCPANPMSGTEENTLFASAGTTLGFAGGMTSIDGVLYLLDLDPSPATNAPTRLSTIVTLPGLSCLALENVDPMQAVGFVNLESLAYCEDDETLYSVDFDFMSSTPGSPHEGQLISIDPATGIGSAVSANHMRNDLRIVGLECIDGVLWGVSGGFATRNPELVTIDRTTGLATIIGLTNTTATNAANPVIESLAFDSDAKGVGLVGAGPDFYAIDESTGAATMIGTGPRTAWAMTTVPAPEPSAAALGIAALGALRIRRRANP